MPGIATNWRLPKVSDVLNIMCGLCLPEFEGFVDLYWVESVGSQSQMNICVGMHGMQFIR